jgi:succinate dehydrogenase / fumarate reductase, flavoprotein subunit
MMPTPEIIRTEVLIVGGGVAGLVAAVAARKARAEVTVVDKATPGRSGQGGMAGGQAWVLAPDDDLEAWARWLVQAGDFLNDQDFLFQLGRRSHPVLSELREWGVPLSADAHGNLAVGQHPAMPRVWSHTTFDPDRITVALGAMARAQGVRLVSKTQVLEPILVDGRVVGGAGFDVVTGNPVLFLAKATILANGSCDYRGERLFRTSSGEGSRFAFRAGARLRNAEFGNLYLPRFEGLDCTFRGTLLRHVTNARGERLWDRYLGPDQGEDMGRFILGMVRENEALRGPCQLDFTTLSEHDPDRPRGNHPSNPERLLAKLLDVDPDAAAPLQQVVPAFVGKLSPVAVDLGYRTDVPGLWAIGDVSHMGSSFEGAMPGGQIAGTSITYGLISGFDAGTAIGSTVWDMPAPPADPDAGQCVAQVLAPLGRGGTRTDDLIRSVQEVVFPVRFSLLRTEARLDEALARLDRLKSEAADLGALDPHELLKAHEARSMLLAAEMTFRAARLRTESRGSHLREDQPGTRDAEWLAWIVVVRDADGMRLTKERVPVDRYPIQPGPRPSPWDPPLRIERPSSPPPTTRRPRARVRPSVLPEIGLRELQLRGLDDQRADLARWRGKVVVLAGGGYGAISQAARWSQALEELAAANEAVVFYRLAVVKLPSFVPRLVVKNQLRKAAGRAPFLVAWDARERASLPVTRDDVPYVFLFDTDGWLAVVLEEEHSEEAVGRLKGALGELTRAR